MTNTGSPELEQVPKVLEIGCGRRAYNLAVNCGGLLFEDEGAEYTGVDLAETLQDDLSDVVDRTDVIEADARDLPFEDRSFDAVLMRSMFGQFTNKNSKFNIDNVRFFGLMEAWRVLRPNGEIAVAEENTPWHPEPIERALQYMGFHVAAFAYMHEGHWDEVDHETSDWIQLRKRYFNDEPTQRAPIGMFGAGDAPPYMMTATKPEDAEEISEKILIHREIRNDGDNKEVYTDREYTRGKKTQETSHTKAFSTN